MLPKKRSQKEKNNSKSVTFNLAEPTIDIDKFKEELATAEIFKAYLDIQKILEDKNVTKD